MSTIEDLTADNARLREDLARVTGERDGLRAAIEAWAKAAAYAPNLPGAVGLGCHDDGQAHAFTAEYGGTAIQGQWLRCSRCGLMQLAAVGNGGANGYPGLTIGGGAVPFTFGETGVVPLTFDVATIPGAPGTQTVNPLDWTTLTQPHPAPMPYVHVGGAGAPLHPDQPYGSGS